MTCGDSPAFPEVHIHHFQSEDADGKHDSVVPRWMGGLTKREYFAAMAMQGMMTHSPEDMLHWCSGGPDKAYTPGEWVASNAVAMADALIAELSKRESD